MRVCVRACVRVSGGITLNNMVIRDSVDLSFVVGRNQEKRGSSSTMEVSRSTTRVLTCTQDCTKRRNVRVN